MQILDKDFYPDDHLRDVVTKNNQTFKAIVKRKISEKASQTRMLTRILGIVTKTPLEIYQNTASRFKLTASTHTENRLADQSKKEISLCYSSK